MTVLGVILVATVVALPALRARDHSANDPNLLIQAGSARRVAAADPAATTYPYDSLGTGWAAVVDIVDDSVAQARARGMALQLCVRAVDTRRGELYCAGEQTPVAAASTIKVPLAVAVLERFGYVLDHDVAVGYGDMRGGSGTLVASGVGDYELGELLRRMIVVSDNSATVVLLRRLGSVEAANVPTARIDPASDFHVGNFAGALPRGASASTITAQSAAHYIYELLLCADERPECRLTTARAAQYLVSLMRQQEVRTKIGRDLPVGSYGSKTGDLSSVSHDIGFVDTSHGRMVFTAVSTAQGMGSPDGIIATAAADVVAAIKTGGDPR